MYSFVSMEKMGAGRRKREEIEKNVIEFPLGNITLSLSWLVVQFDDHQFLMRISLFFWEGGGSNGSHFSSPGRD